MPDWYPYDYMPGDGDARPVDEPREPGRIKWWWWRHFNAYIGPVPVPHWLYYLTPDRIHKLAGTIEEKIWRDEDEADG